MDPKRGSGTNRLGNNKSIYLSLSLLTESWRRTEQSVPLPCLYTSISESLSLCSLISTLFLPTFSQILSCPKSGWSSGSVLSQSQASFFIGTNPFQVALLSLLTWLFKFIMPFIVSYCIHTFYCPGDWASASRERHTMWISLTLLPSSPLMVMGSWAPLCSGPFTSVSDLFCGYSLPVLCCVLFYSSLSSPVEENARPTSQVRLKRLWKAMLGLLPTR